MFINKAEKVTAMFVNIAVVPPNRYWMGGAGLCISSLAFYVFSFATKEHNIIIDRYSMLILDFKM